jgi:hypothetical protein
MLDDVRRARSGSNEGCAYDEFLRKRPRNANGSGRHRTQGIDGSLIVEARDDRHAGLTDYFERAFVTDESRKLRAPHDIKDVHRLPVDFAVTMNQR